MTARRFDVLAVPGVPASPREDLCRTQVDVALAPAAVAELLARPLGNHLVLVPGRWAARRGACWDWAVAP